MAETPKATEKRKRRLKSEIPSDERREPKGDPILGMIIKRARDKKGITQTQLGAAVGVTYGQISQYESGTTSVPADKAARLAMELSIPQEVFFQAPPGMHLLSELEVSLVHHFRAARDEMRQAVLVILGSDQEDRRETD